MAKRGGPKQEGLEAPSEIIVWNPSKEKEPHIIEDGQTTPSIGSGEALLYTATRSEGASLGASIDADQGMANHKRRFWGLLLVPCLVFSNVLIALSWDVEQRLCSWDGDPTPSGSITLDGAEYDLYRFDHEDLDLGGRFYSEDGGCGLSDWTIRTANEIDLFVRTSGYSAYDACSLEGDSKCNDAVVQEGTTWIPMERCRTHCLVRNLGPVDGYFAFDDGGLFEDGSFLVAVEPSLVISDFEVEVRPYEPILILFFSIFLTPTALWLVNRWVKTSHQPNLPPGAIVFAKNVLKVGILHGLSLTCLYLLGEYLFSIF